jgi:hypothetical protein
LVRREALALDESIAQEEDVIIFEIRDERWFCELEEEDLKKQMERAL